MSLVYNVSLGLMNTFSKHVKYSITCHSGSNLYYTSTRGGKAEEGRQGVVT